ncbi:MAG: bifunctional sulfate adenylyltransferase subunit 1/adenylylsulfate kinase, partial [Bdellovibrio sp.]
MKYIVKVCTAGSVDDGKSTLLGRLLYETGNVPVDQLASVRQRSRRSGFAAELDFSLITDGLKDEQEQKITVDVAYRYFSSKKRRYTLVDVPGHEQYTRNMVTGASSCDAAILLISAENGITEQTRRHAFLLHLMGIRQVLVVFNKMDLVEYSEQVFDRLKADFLNFSERLQGSRYYLIPCNSVDGENLVRKSAHMPWFQGPSIMACLDDLNFAVNREKEEIRLPVQLPLRFGQVGGLTSSAARGGSVGTSADPNGRAYAGTIANGRICKGMTVQVLPNGVKAAVTNIRRGDREVSEAYAGQAVSVQLDREIDIFRGSMICGVDHAPPPTLQFDADLIWLSDQPMNLKKRYKLRHTTWTVATSVDEIKYGINVNTLKKVK